MSELATCTVLIGTPTNWRACGLPGDPCGYHALVSGPPRSLTAMRALERGPMAGRAYRLAAPA